MRVAEALILVVLLAVPSADAAWSRPGHDPDFSFAYPTPSRPVDRLRLEEKWSFGLMEPSSMLVLPGTSTDHIVLADRSALIAIDHAGDVFWRKELAGPAVLHTIFTDRDGQRILASTRENGLPKLLLLSGDGTELTSVNIPSSNSSGIGFADVIKIHGNSTVVVYVNTGFGPPIVRGLFAFSYPMLNPVWEYLVGPGGSPTMAVRDLIHTGSPDLVLGGCTQHNGNFARGRGDDTLTGDHWLSTIAVTGDGLERLTVPRASVNETSEEVTVAAHEHGCLAVATGDFDFVGNAEILTFESHDSTYYTGAATLRVLDGGTGQTKAQFEGAENAEWMGWALADTDGDNRKEVAVGSSDGQVTLLSPDLRKITQTGAYSQVLLANDLDGNGRPDFVVANPGASRLGVVDATLAEMWSTNVAGVRRGSSGAVFTALVADLDHDGRNEVAILADRLYLFESSGCSPAECVFNAFMDFWSTEIGLVVLGVVLLGVLGLLTYLAREFLAERRRRREVHHDSLRASLRSFILHSPAAVTHPSYQPLLDSPAQSIAPLRHLIDRHLPDENGGLGDRLSQYQADLIAYEEARGRLTARLIDDVTGATNLPFEKGWHGELDRFVSSNFIEAAMKTLNSRTRDETEAVQAAVIARSELSAHGMSVAKGDQSELNRAQAVYESIVGNAEIIEDVSALRTKAKMLNDQREHLQSELRAIAERHALPGLSRERLNEEARPK